MASMTTEFYKMTLFRRGDGNELDYKLIRNILEEVIRVNAVDHGEYKSIDLSPGIGPDSVEPKEIMDIFEDDKYLFGKIGRKKANNTLQKRNYGTLAVDHVFDDKEALYNGIEMFTFFILDYSQGILSVVNTKGAPNTKAFDALGLNYCRDYEFEFEDIPNEEGILVLYGSEEPEISRFEFEVPAPNAEYLQRVLGLEEEVISEMIQNGVYSAGITLKAIPYHKILSKKESIKNVLNILLHKKNQYSKAVVRGNSEKFGSRNFDLRSKYFTYPIEIKRYRTKQGKQVEYSLLELVEQYKYGLHMAYEENYDTINAIANR